MIDDETKTKFLEELEKIGNVWAACLKTNIHRSTYYRWKKSDKEFKRKANIAEHLGRANISDIAENGLLGNIKKGDPGSIKYALSHNSPHYRNTTPSRVILEHIRRSDPIKNDPEVTLEDIVDEIERRSRTEEEEKLKNGHNILPTDTADSKSVPDKPDSNPSAPAKKPGGNT
jgi:hypothetical protein